MSTEYGTKEPSKAQLAYERIKSDIITNKLKPGSVLIERQICDIIKMSRTPVRESFRQLINDGFLEFIPGKGVFVSAIRYEDVVEIYQLRGILEGFAAKLATPRMTPKVLEALKHNIIDQQQAVNSGDLEKFLTCDLDFHKLWVTSSGNRRLIQLLQLLNDQIKRVTFSTKSDKQRALDSLAKHQEIVDGFMQNDSEKVERTVNEHTKDVMEYHLRQLEANRNIDF
jgi:DNA-binding GntR family transcriptional regulator